MAALMTRVELNAAVKALFGSGRFIDDYRHAPGLDPARRREQSRRGGQAKAAGLLARFPQRATELAYLFAGQTCDRCQKRISDSLTAEVVMRLPGDLETATDPESPRLYHARCEPAWSRIR